MIGCSNGVISRCINKGTDISSLWVSKIIETFDDINPTWLLTGKGDTFINSTNHLPQNTEHNTDINNILLTLIKEKEEIIRKQDREIGRLQEQIQNLQNRLGKDALDANTFDTANAG